VLHRRLPVALAALGACLAAAAPAHAGLRFERCGGYGYSCARMGVPLDWSGAVPGRVSLRVQRIRSRLRPARGAVFVLAGGPGQSATATFSRDGVGLLFPAYRSRDVFVLDQRGTGLSGALRCRELQRADLLDAGTAAGRCAARLGARRGLYTTADSVADLEALRSRLGVERIVLFGTSYGTKVALAYALSHPDRVERLALDSVVAPDGPDPFYRDTLAAVPRVLRTLCGARCRPFTRDPVADLEALVGRMRSAPLRGPLVDAGGRRRRAAATRSDLLGILLGGDFDPRLRNAFPGAVHAALRGDAAPLLRLRRQAFRVVGSAPPVRIFSAGLYAAATCEETALPWDRAAPADPAERRRQAAAALAGVPEPELLPFDRATVLHNDVLALCSRWPAAGPPPALGPGPLPDVPVLLLAGEDDLRTPVEGAQRLAASFPRASLVVSPATGHSALGSDRSRCARRAFDRFFRGGPVPAQCAGVRRPRPQPPPPRRLGAVEPVRGVRGPRGRALAAVGLTLRDVMEHLDADLAFDPRSTLVARGGGLRAGSYRLGMRFTLVLRRLAYVPGVRLSGRVRRVGERRQRGVIRLTGRGTPAGRLRLRGNRVRGTLGGRRVRARLVLTGVAGAAAAAAARLPAGWWRRPLGASGAAAGRASPAAGW
jgi:pimeloyl-ACP methyl ester carboxylesterase